MFRHKYLQNTYVIYYRDTKGEKIDGIIYKSSLKGATSDNIVLFYNTKSSANVLDLINIT
jgi:hypothetical protein